MNKKTFLVTLISLGFCIGTELLCISAIKKADAHVTHATEVVTETRAQLRDLTAACDKQYKNYMECQAFLSDCQESQRKK